MIGDGFRDEPVEFPAGQAPAGGIRPAGDQAVGDVVGMALALPDGVGWRQPVAGLVPKLAGEQGGLGSRIATTPAPRGRLEAPRRDRPLGAACRL